MSDNELKRRLQKAMNKQNTARTIGASESGRNSQSDGHSDSDARERAGVSGGHPGDPGPELLQERNAERPLKWFGWLCMAAFAVMLVLSPDSAAKLSGDAAEKALSDQVSTSLSAGTVLLTKDENIGQQDYTIVHQSSQEDTTIWVWDYAAEDGDYVQILLDGAPLTDAFMIRHKPKPFVVPAVGLVQIRGVKDGGGGITYAVRYELNGTTYFNSAPEGEHNTYTLIRE